MKAVVAAFNQEKALVGAFSMITNLRMDLFETLEVTQVWDHVRILIVVALCKLLPAETEAGFQSAVKSLVKPLPRPQWKQCGHSKMKTTACRRAVRRNGWQQEHLRDHQTRGLESGSS